MSKGRRMGLCRISEGAWKNNICGQALFDVELDAWLHFRDASGRQPNISHIFVGCSILKGSPRQRSILSTVRHAGVLIFNGSAP